MKRWPIRSGIRAINDLLVRYAEGGALGERQSREMGAKLCRRSGSGPARWPTAAQARSLRLPTELSDELVGSEQELADLFAESKQIADSAEVRKLGRPPL